MQGQRDKLGRRPGRRIPRPGRRLPAQQVNALVEVPYDGLVAAQPGVGTFIRVTLADASQTANGPLAQGLTQWVSAARESGLDDESIQALFNAALRSERPDDVEGTD